MRFKANSVYLLFKFSFSMLLSMATVLSLVYHLEVVGLNALELVLVGTVLETSCFILEIPTGVVADLYSRRRSVLIGVFLYGAGLILEGSLPWFGTVLLAQVIWGCGDTFITGALEAWIASEERGEQMDKTFLKGGQAAQAGGIVGVIIGTMLGNVDLRLPLVLSGILFLLLGVFLMQVMPERNFTPALEEKGSLLHDIAGLFKVNLRFVKGAPILLALLGITFFGGLASEGFDRLSTAHFLQDTVMPSIWWLNEVTWFGAMSLAGSVLGILVTQLLIARLEKRGEISRNWLVFFTSGGYILCLLLFAFGRNFWLMLVAYLAGGLMRGLKEPVIAAWMNEQVEEKMRATVFSANGQMDSFGQIIGGPLAGMIAQQVSVSWGLAFTGILLLPALILTAGAAYAGKEKNNG